MVWPCETTPLWNPQSFHHLDIHAYNNLMLIGIWLNRCNTYICTYKSSLFVICGKREIISLPVDSDTIIDVLVLKTGSK